MKRNSGPAIVAMAMLTLLLAACSDDDAPYLAFDGGGFIFNYRIAEAFYGVNVRPMRHLAPGTVLEAEFENPAGAAPFIVRETVIGDRLRYSFRTPPLTGVEAKRKYRVRVRVIAAQGGAVLGVYERTVQSDLDQSALPERPLTIGPGYDRNPETMAPPTLSEPAQEAN